MHLESNVISYCAICMVKNVFATLDVINQKRNPNNITQILHFLASSFTYGYVGGGGGRGRGGQGGALVGELARATILVCVQIPEKK